MIRLVGIYTKNLDIFDEEIFQVNVMKFNCVFIKVQNSYRTQCTESRNAVIAKKVADEMFNFLKFKHKFFIDGNWNQTKERIMYHFITLITSDVLKILIVEFVNT